MLGLAIAAAVSTTNVVTSRGDQPLAVYGAASPDKPLVLLLSGEGGWRAFDDEVASRLAAHGYAVGGIDCLRYFKTAQDDRAALAKDVRLFADALASTVKARAPARIVLAGYSFGADLAPWVAGVADRDPRIAALLLIGPDKVGSLQARLSEILGFHPTDHVFDTAEALADARDLPVLFVHGGDDEESDAPALCEGFPGKKRLVVVPGSHHFSGHLDTLEAALADGLATLLPK
ncbi:MAG TPA: AcvB/VirJ family lysyl-phosphatidylglycerol hydrolase [Candidatus Polarisedimenticolaceae bacterium]|nr:AcvB/VirJ family lysyl-phosphatidylglycerol hydrolase [Candidatus Polarisedimenticolaceae bacterium]